MISPFRALSKGSVALVALCFVAVLGITLASYLAVSNQAMNLGNRSALTSVSTQLAEMGLERGLWSFNRTDWTNWTITGTTATRTISFGATKYGSSGITTSIHLRADHYNASIWSAATNYTTNSHVSHRGVWFQCVSAHNNIEPPNATYWISAPSPWNADAYYNIGDITLSGGSAYRCILGHNNQTPPNATYWTAHTAAVWSATTTYAVNDVALSGGTAYRCIVGHTNQTPPNSTYWISAPAIYSEGVALLPNSSTTTGDDARSTIKTQLRAAIAPAPLLPNAIGAGTLVSLPSSATIDSYDSKAVLSNIWSATKTYNSGDGVFYPPTGLTYRCIATHTNQLPTNTAYWTLPAAGHAGWSSASVDYAIGDVVYYQPAAGYGLLYRCISSHTSNASRDPGNTNYWSLETTSSNSWSSGTTYSAGDFAYSAGAVYRCILGHINQFPPNATYWDLMGSYSTWDAGTTYSMHQIVYSGTSLYRYINSTPSSGNLVTNASYWSTVLPSYSYWLANTSYSNGTVVYYPPTGLIYRYNYSVATSGNTPTTSEPTWTSPYWAYLGPGYTSWTSGVTYSYGHTVYYPGDGWVYYYNNASSSSGNVPAAVSAYWVRLRPGFTGWSAAASYSIGDVAYYANTGLLYRSTADNNLNNLPTNTAFWSAALTGYAGWSAATTYTIGDIVYYPTTGLLYRYGSTSSSSGNLPTNTSFWFQLSPGLTSWLPATAYNVGDIVQYATNGLTYRCISAHTSTLFILPTNTTYWSVSMPGNSAVLAGGNTAATAVTVTSARVNGYVAAPPASTSPYAPRWSYGGTAIVTSVASPTVPSPRVDLTRISRSPYIPQFDIQSVSGAGNLPNGSSNLPDGINTIGTPGATTPVIYNITGTYDNGTSTLRSGLYLEDANDILTINGPVILNVSGTLRTDSGRIVISPTGSLEIYFTGQLWGGGSSTSGIQNLTFDPKKCVLVGTSTSNTAGAHYYWSTIPYYGVIYMPNAYLSTWTNVVAYGAYSAKNVAFPQAGNLLHYDSSLRTVSKIGTFIDAPYIISEWRELSDLAERITLP